MNKPATTICNGKIECHCYKCCITNVIITNKITDQFPAELLNFITAYIGIYFIHGKLNNEYQMLPQLSELIDQPDNIYIHQNYIFFYSHNNSIHFSFINQQKDTTEFTNPLQLKINNDQLILSAISFKLRQLFGVNETDHSNKINTKFVIAKTNIQTNTFLIINPTSLQLFEINFDGTHYKISTLPKLEKELKWFQTSTSSRIKKAIHFCDNNAWWKYWFLFEDGTLIQIPITDGNPYPAHYTFAKADRLSSNARDIAAGTNHQLIIDKDNNLWVKNQYYNEHATGLPSMPSTRPFPHPGKEFQHNNVKIIRCNNDVSCVILDNGLCYLFGVLYISTGVSLSDFRTGAPIPIRQLSFSYVRNDEYWTLFQRFDNCSDVKIVDVAIGKDHVILLDDKGEVYGIGDIFVQNEKKIFCSPCLIKRHEIGILNPKQRIVKLLAADTRSFFVTCID